MQSRRQLLIVFAALTAPGGVVVLRCAAQEEPPARPAKPAAARELPAVLVPEEAANPAAQPPALRPAAPAGAAARNRGLLRRDAAGDAPAAPAAPVAGPQEALQGDAAVQEAARLHRLKVIRRVEVQLQNTSLIEASTTDDPSTALNVNEELERLLERADQIVAGGRADLAPVLWQRVLDEGIGVLATQAGGVDRTSRHTYQRYRPLQEEAERRILAAGPEALRSYRLHADGQARALLADSSVERNAFRSTPDTVSEEGERNEFRSTLEADRERRLAEVLRRFFLTTIGDNAAFELACRQLERREYAAAAQLLIKLQQYPDSDTPRDAVVTRLAAALSRIGAAAAASEALAAESSLSPDVRSLLEADFARGTTGAPPAAPVAGWPMRHGNAARTGVMPGVGASTLPKILADAWEYRPNFTLKASPPGPSGQTRTTNAIINGRRVMIELDASGRITQPKVDPRGLPDLARGDLATKWKTSGWRPAGDLLFASGRVLLKAEDRVVCCDAGNGRVVWMGRKTKFPLDAQTQQMAQIEMAGWRVADQPAGARPRSYTEIVLFGDRLSQSMTVAGDLVLVLEGELDYGIGVKPAAQDPANEAMQMQMLLGQRGQAGSTARKNWLAAYDLPTGKLRWHRGSSEGAEAVQGSFLSAPLPVGEALIVAVFDEGRIGLAALERSTGRTLWKTPLCDTPADGMAPWAPVGLGADDGNVYVATGAGAIFALDALSGGVQWAVSYPRRLPADLAQQQQLQAAMMGGGGDARAMTPSRAEFLENIAVRHDDAVVILTADTDFLFALDCRSGALRWEAPLAPPTGNGPVQDYLGVRRGKLFLAGPSAVRRYDLSGGRLEWERRVDGSCGRGLLTEKSLYLPQNNRIVQFDPDDGHELAVVDVMTPDGEPVGNLYGDGTRLYAVGAARVSALGPAAAEQETK